MSASPPRITVDSRRVEQLEAAICGLARKLNSTTHRMLELIRDFDDRCGWAKWGHKSCAEWLQWRCQISLSAAREQVRTAQALRRLPKLSAALADGELSYTKVRALTRVATEQDEELLLAYARRASAQDVEDRVRQMRNTAPESAEQARRAWERRSLTVLRKPNRGTFLISIEVPEADGEIVVRAIERAIASGDVAVGEDHFTAHGEDRSATDGWCAQQADAIVAVAKAYLARTGRRAASSDGDGDGDGDGNPVVSARDEGAAPDAQAAESTGTSVADH